MAAIQQSGRSAVRRQQQAALDAQRAADAARSADAERRTAPPAAQSRRAGTVSTGPDGRTIAVLPRTATPPPKPPPPPPTPPPVTPRPPTPPNPRTTGGPNTNPPPPAPPPPPKPDTPTVTTPGGPQGPGAGAVKPELEGGPIPTTENEWESRRLWEEYSRRQETAKVVRELAQMDAQRREATARAAVSDERRSIALGMKGTSRAQAAHALSVSTHLSTMSREATRAAGVEATLLEGEEAQRALEYRRTAEIAQINMDGATADIAALRAEAGQLRVVTAAELAERDHRITELQEQARFDIEDANLDAERANAEAMVLSAARGAGGSLVEQQQAGIEAERERTTTRIARKRDVSHAQLTAQKRGITARGTIAQAKVRAATIKAGGRYQAEWKDKKTATERETLTRTQATTRAAELRTKGRLESARIALQASEMTIASDRATLASRTYEADSYDMLYDAQAERANAKFLKQTVADGKAALLARPPIPDWDAIGKKADRNARWSRWSGIIRTGIGIAGLFR